MRVIGKDATLKPTSKDHKFKISYEPGSEEEEEEEGYLKIKLSERPCPCQRCRHTEFRGEIMGEDVRITSLLYVIFVNFSIQY